MGAGSIWTRQENRRKSPDGPGDKSWEREKEKVLRILLYNPDNGVTRNFMPHLWMFLLEALTPPGHEVLLIDGNAQPMDEAAIAQGALGSTDQRQLVTRRRARGPDCSFWRQVGIHRDGVH